MIAVLIVLGVVVALALLFWLRKHPPFPWFSRHFAWFFAASALLFASAHLANEKGPHAFAHGPSL